MSCVPITVKWGKETYKNIDVDISQPGAALKQLLQRLTGVPPDRQKVMAAKAWKGMLKDDQSLAACGISKDTVITLMGSAESIQRPAEGIVFTEDLPPEHQVSAGAALPAGLHNLGNTCYANSTLEALRYVPELKNALVQYRKSPRGTHSSDFGPVASALADSFLMLDSSREPIRPISFLTKLRAAFPKFAEAGPGGIFKQQDSEEFHSSLLTALAAELTSATSDINRLSPIAGHGVGPNIVDTLFGVQLDVELRCKESSDEPTTHSREFSRKLVCNIEGGAGKAVQINFMHEGIRHGLEGEVEKRSELLGRNALWTSRARIALLPKYLCVQMMRFYWKATPQSQDHAGVSCKMLRPVSFPADNFDVYDLCTDRVREVLKRARDRAAAASGLTSGPRARDDSIATAGPSQPSSPLLVSASAGATRAPNAMDLEGDFEDADVAAALRMSMDIDGSQPEQSAADANVIGYGLPHDFRGLYELFAVVTHKGRSSDSGHYMAWLRSERDHKKWLVFDDDAVSETDTEYVTSRLTGGGDDHMAYLLLYRAKA